MRQKCWASRDSEEGLCPRGGPVKATKGEAYRVWRRAGGAVTQDPELGSEG